MEPGLVVLGVRERVVGEEVGQRHVPPLVAHLHDDLVGKRNARLLNLFAYTGAFSVWGAKAGAHTTTADLSNTYLEWAERNFEHYGLDPHQHVFVRADVTTRLEREATLGRTYDLIVIDPPTFSRSL